MMYAIKITFVYKGKKKVHYWGMEDKARLHLYNNFKPFTDKERADWWASRMSDGNEYPIYKNADIEILEIN